MIQVLRCIHLYILLLISLAALPNLINAQDKDHQGVTIDLTVTDLNTTLPYANVIIDNYIDSKLERNTDELGRLSATVNPSDSISIFVSYIGYESKSIKLIVNESKKFKLTAKLDSFIYLLDSAYVTYTSKSKYIEDTTIFLIDSFKTNNDYHLIDMVNNLPFVEYNNGVLKYRGKIISKMLINGETFAFGKPGYGLSKLPLKAFEKIRIIENFVDPGTLLASDSPVIDLTLKETYNNIYFGDILVGKGYRLDEHIASVNLNKFNPNNKLHINLSRRNTSVPTPEELISKEAILSYLDHPFGLTYGLKDIAENQKNIRNLINQINLFASENTFGNLDFQKSLHPKLSINIINHLSHNINKYQDNIITSLNIPELDNPFLLSSLKTTRWSKTTNSLNQFNIKFKPNNNWYFLNKIKTNFSTVNSQENQLGASLNNDLQRSFDVSEQQTIIQSNSILRFQNRINKLLFDLSYKKDINNRIEDLGANRVSQILELDTLNDSFIVNQINKQNENKLSYFSLYERQFNSFIAYSFAEYKNSQSTWANEASQRNDDNSEQLKSLEQFNSSFNVRDNELLLITGLKKKSRKLNLNAALSIARLQYTLFNEISENTKTRYNLAPYLKFKYLINKNEYINTEFNYSLKNPSNHHVTRNPLLLSTFRLQVGSDEISIQQNVRASLRYDKKINKYGAGLSLNFYVLLENDGYIINQISQSNALVYQSLLFNGFKARTLNLNLSYSTASEYKKNTLNISGFLNRNHFALDGSLVRTYIRDFQFNHNFNYYSSKKSTLESISLNHGLSYRSNLNRVQNNWSLQYSVEANIKLNIANKIRLSTSYNYSPTYFNVTNRINNSFHNLNLYIESKVINKRLKAKIGINNIFNAENITTVNNQDIFVNTFDIKLFPRTGFVSLMWSF